MPALPMITALAALALAGSAASELIDVPRSAGVQMRRQLRCFGSYRGCSFWRRSSADADVNTDSEPLAAMFEDNDATCSEQVMALESEPEFAALSAAANTAGFDSSVFATIEPATIFAPSTAAFEALFGPDVLETISLGAHGDFVADILRGHIVDGALLAADLTDGEALTTRLGTQLTVALTGNGDVTLTGADGTVAAVAATVTNADIRVCGSVAHLIDAVLLSAEQAAILDELGAFHGIAGENTPVPPVDISPECEAELMALESEPNLIELAAAVNATGADANFVIFEPLTVFVPTVAAWKAIAGPDPFATLADDLFAEILAGHVLDGAVHEADLTDGETLTTQLGTQLAVTLNRGGGFDLVGPDGAVATVTKADVGMCASVAHIIDDVLLTADQAARLAGKNGDGGLGGYGDGGYGDGDGVHGGDGI